jgi:hypothetical protein
MAILATLTSGCTRIVDLGLDDAPRQLVVEARLEAGDTRQQVLLTTTDAFSRSGALPTATGAIVTVTDDRGMLLSLPELSPGQYQADTPSNQIQAGRTYTLSILWEGEQYEATSRVVAGPRIDSLYVLFRSASLAVGDSGYRAVIDYTDPAGVENYYFWEMFVGGERVVSNDPGNQWRVISRDRYYDGQKVSGYLPFDEQVVLPGEFIQLRQLAITEEAFWYYFAFYDQATGGGSPFSTPPASVRGNVENLTRPDHRALGFFLAAEARWRTLVVPQP